MIINHTNEWAIKPATTIPPKYVYVYISKCADRQHGSSLLTTGVPAILSSTNKMLGEFCTDFQGWENRLLSSQAHVPLLHVHRCNTRSIPFWSPDCKRTATAILPKHGNNMWS